MTAFARRSGCRCFAIINEMDGLGLYIFVSPLSLTQTLLSVPPASCRSSQNDPSSLFSPPLLLLLPPPYLSSPKNATLRQRAPGLVQGTSCIEPNGTIKQPDSKSPSIQQPKQPPVKYRTAMTRVRPIPSMIARWLIFILIRHPEYELVPDLHGRTTRSSYRYTG